jgi:hypothetical protein
VKLATLNNLPTALVAFDTETWAMRDDLVQPIVTELTSPLAPPMVCGSIAALDPSTGRIEGELLDKDAAEELFALVVDDENRTLGGANLPFDLLVVASRFAGKNIDAMPEIFKLLLDDQRAYDELIAEQLDAVAEGCLGKDPRTGGPLTNPVSGKQAGYSLEVVHHLVTGKVDAKVNDEFRLRYRELDGIPISQWPPNATTYPVDDGRNTAEDILTQAGHLPRAGAHHWGPDTTCEWCGLEPKQAYVDGNYVPCRARRRARNLHDLANQVATAWAMHLGAAHGFRVNQDTVKRVEDDALEGRVEAEEPFVKLGLLKRNRDGSTSRDMSAICRAIALAYGADPGRACKTCEGSRKVISPKAKLVRCPTCTPLRKAAETAGAPMPACGRCAATGQIPDPKQLVNCTACGATGLDLDAAPHLPKTETGRVGTGRDVLNESGDEVLMALADRQEDEKTLDVYIPFLRRARVPIAGHAEACPRHVDDHNDCNCPGPYRDVPLTLWPNVLLETGRTSYRGVIQLFPRKPGHKNEKGEWVPSLRECIEARFGKLFSSEDYDSGELVTHAQSCIWICGESMLANALLQGKKVHHLLGAQMIGMGYEEFLAITNDPNHPRYQVCKDARQAAKPGNFGFPGGMGPVKLVLQQRKQGPDTPHPSGPTFVKDEFGNKVRGYKGLRFCILMDNAPACGLEKVTEWPPRSSSGRGREPRPITPTCRQCIECAIRLKEAWLKQWPENVEYFKYINDCMDNGQLITTEHLRLWPHLQGFFVPGRLAPGEIMQHVSGRIRGGTEYCSAANGFFQGLLADLAKSALRRISRECYDRTVIVPEFAHPNSKRSAWAGGRSPLFGHRPIVFAHDEIILEHPEAEAHEGAMRVSEIMVDEMRYYCPDLADACAAEPTLMRRWYKSAVPTWKLGGKKRSAPDDRLVPWEPKH